MIFFYAFYVTILFDFILSSSVNTINSEGLINKINSSTISYSTSINYTLSLENSSPYNFTNEYTKKISLREFYQYAYRMSFNEKNTIIITIILSIISIIGSFSNLLVLIVFTFKDDCMEYDANKKKQKFSQKNNSYSHQLLKNSKTFTTKKNNSIKSTNPIYLLIKYLALVDFLTCFLVIPCIIYEMWFLASSNEILCKSFEFIRGTGVALSNFLVILISFERFILLSQPFSFFKFKNFIFKPLLILITLFSLFIGGIAMLQMSVYQLDENGDVTLTNICLPSSVILSVEFREKINQTFIYMFLIGAIVVGFLYIFIFHSAFKLNQKRANRMKKNEKMFSNAEKFSSGKFSKKYSHHLLNDKEELSRNYDGNTIDLQKIEVNLQEAIDLSCTKKKSPKSKNSFTIFKSNMRVALMIFFVTLSYYVSVIPWCLLRNGIIKYNLFIYYTFLMNNSLNPVIYGFFNPNFRHYCFEILRGLFDCNTKRLVQTKKHYENSI